MNRAWGALATASTQQAELHEALLKVTAELPQPALSNEKITASQVGLVNTLRSPRLMRGREIVSFFVVVQCSFKPLKEGVTRPSLVEQAKIKLEEIGAKALPPKLAAIWSSLAEEA